MTGREEAIVPSWDGEPAGWPEYSRRVRLCYQQTPAHKRYTLGPKLVLKLKGKAWEIASSVNYEELESNSGTQYLLGFLRARLGRLPIPDVGQHLDELFVRCRRSPGTDMVTWCNQLREAYKKVQRSLARTTTVARTTVAVQTDQQPEVSELSSPTSSTRRRMSGSEPHREPGAKEQVVEEGREDPSMSPGLHGETEEEKRDTPRSSYSRDGGGWWRQSWHEYGWQDWSSWKTDAWAAESVHVWEEDEAQLPEIIPEEVLGWLLMRRSGLPSAAKLSIQAAAGNSLRFSDVEKAMRQQEDELMNQERQKHSQRSQRSYWVEREGDWGIFLADVDEDLMPGDEQIQWVDPGAMHDMWGSPEVSETDHFPTVMYSDGFEWQWHDDEWHTQGADGEWVAFSDMKPWLDIDDVGHHDPTAAKELQELFVAFDQKVRTFKEARNAVYQKGKNRGFYKGGKGKGKGHPGKSKKGSPSPSTAFTLQTSGKGKSNNSPTTKPGYTGCFICGDLAHDFRNCPKRGQASGPTTKAKMIGMVEEVTEIVEDASPKSSSPPAADLQRLILAAAASGSASDPQRLGWAVVDTGATETVGSLEAIEHVMERRASVFGQEKVGLNCRKKKRFKFGNAQEQESASFILLPQRIQGTSTSLGIYTLDVPGVPILIGIKTLSRLGALVDVNEPSLIFRKNFPGIRIPLVRGQNGHLLLDLCRDWCPTTWSPENACAMTLHEHSDPAEKGPYAQDPTSPCPTSPSHDIHVLDDLSETSSVALSAVHQESDPPAAEISAQAILQTAETEPSAFFSPSDDIVREKHGRGPQKGRHGDLHERDGDGGHSRHFQNESGPEQVRLGQGSTSRSSRCAGGGEAVHGPALHCSVLSGKCVGDQWVRNVADLPDLQPSTGLHPNLGVERDASKSGPITSRHLRSAGTTSSGDAGGVDDSGHRSEWSRDFRPSSLGEDSRGEGKDESKSKTKSQEWQPARHGLGSERQETSQAGPSASPRSTRTGDHSVLSRIGRVGQDRFSSKAVNPVDHPKLEDDTLWCTEPACSSCTVDTTERGKSVLLESGNSLWCTEPACFSCTVDTTEHDKSVLLESLQCAHREFVETFLAVSHDNMYKCDLVEIGFGPSSTLTHTINERGGKAFRIGPENNMDLTTEHGFARAEKFLEIVKPRWIWASPVCGPTSPLQHQKTEQQMKSLKQKLRKSRKLSLRVVKLCERQIANGGHVCWEWPRFNQGWTFSHVRQFFDNLEREGLLHVAKLDGCQVDIRAPDTGELLQKPWNIKTTSLHMYQTLNRQCSHDHPHSECFEHGRAHTSAFYSHKMCHMITDVVLEETRQTKQTNDSEAAPVFALESFDLPPWNEKELKEKKELVRRLHVRAGHPTNRALHNMLKARGVDPRILPLALGHQCDDCAEVRLPVPHKNVSLHTSDVLWSTMQMDIAQLVTKDQTVHILLMVDEASRFTVAAELFRTQKQESRNATTEEIIRTVETFWVQFHGFPNRIRCDPESAFRGTALADWTESRGILLEPCPAEDHGAIGIVEATIGKLKEDVRAVMRTMDADPFSAMIHVVNAHNECDRIGGYAPCQWAYGRLPDFDGRLFEGGHGLPIHSSEGTMGTDLRANLQLRMKAEEQYRRSQAVLKINRAMKSQVRPHQIFVPGDLVYYKRYKTPHGETTSHPGIDVPKVGLSRWFGPARVLATETRAEENPPVRKPSSIVWIVSAGKLKRCSPHQLRHCTEREKLLAEASEAVTMPWSFSSLLNLVEQGQYQRYDDMERDEVEPQFRERELRTSQHLARTRSRSRPAASVRARSRSHPLKSQKAEQEEKKILKDERRQADPEPKGQGQSAEVERRHQQQKRPVSSAPLQHDTKVPRSHDFQPSELESHPPFQRARERASATISSSSQKAIDLVNLCDEVFSLKASPEFNSEESVGLVFQLEVAMPDNKKDLKRFTRDSETWVSRKMKKGVDLKWAQIPKDRIADFIAAKDKEVSNWVRENAIRLTKDKILPHRAMRMRWVYTIKQDGSAKARLVIIGFEDPDLTELRTTSPTMSRRTRGLFLTACSLHGWTALKGDVKAAFLQGQESEEERAVFTKPVIELSKALGGDENSYGQIIKACYGLANAPSQWYKSVSTTMQEAGFEMLQSEPCAWRLMDGEGAERVVVGLACAHVDDFLFGGDSSSAKWQQAVSYVYNKYKWSPWECDEYTHCGVNVVQASDGSVVLDHSGYSSNIEQMKVTGTEDDPVTDAEKQQLRGILGAVQWRAYQTAPHHCARLSLLQSQMSSPTKSTLREANKLVREVYQFRHVSPRYQRLGVENPLDVTFVAWTDAAVGNRRSFDSSGGYFIAAVEPKMLEGKPSLVNPISWKAGKLPRVARSSLSAEIQAFSIAEEELMFVRLEWAEMCGKDILPHDPTSIVKDVKGVLVTDAKSLFDIIQKGSHTTSGFGLKEKYSVLEVMSLFQRLEMCATETRWVHSGAQLADSLTKPVTNGTLVRVLLNGTWTLVDDPKFTSEKRLRRTYRESSSKVLGACESG